MRKRALLRNAMAKAIRSLPALKGKARIGQLIGKRLTDASSDADCIVTIEMKRGGRMIIDLRSRTELMAFWTGQYDDEVIETIVALLSPDATVLDVGANVGFYSIAIGRHLAVTGGVVYAFEPLMANYRRLRENIENNGLHGVVRPENIALGECEGTVIVRREDEGGAKTGNGIIRHRTEDTHASNEECVVKRLDDVAGLCGITRCDFIKVDIEGHEYRFLVGAMDFISEHRPIVFGEFNTHWMKRCGDSIRDVADLLEPLGYHPHILHTSGEFAAITELHEGQEDVWWLPMSGS